jgi:hypothetical protein
LLYKQEMNNLGACTNNNQLSLNIKLEHRIICPQFKAYSKIPKPAC